MARRRFGADLTAVVWRTITADGNADVLQLARGLSGITAWTAQTGGSQVTDLQAAGGAAVTSVTADANGELDFFGPATSPETIVLWLDAGTGARQQIVASDLPASLAASIATLTAGLAGAAAVADLAARPVFIVYGTGTVPSRTAVTADTTRMAVWVGTTAPPIAANGTGGAAVDGLDWWWKY